MINSETMDYDFGDIVAHCIEDWLREQKGYENHDFYVQSIDYFNWDIPAYFVFLIEDGKSLKKGAKYKEIVITDLGEAGIPIEIDFATHGFPCISTRVWEVIL